MEYRELGKTGLQVSGLGLGCSPFGGVFGDTDFNECKRCLDTALDLGVNILDCSPYYGLTRAETMLGQTLRGVPREQFLISTKVGRYGATEAAFDFSPGRVTQSVDESLGRLGLDYVDFILCHDIEFTDLQQIVDETLPALNEVVRAGKARYVGITGLPLKVFREVLSQAQVDVILSYCHFSLNDDTLAGLIPELEAAGVGIFSASPFSMGLLTQTGPPEWHPAPAELKAACSKAAAYCAARGVTIEKLAVQFSLSQPRISTTFLGASKAEYIAAGAGWMEEAVDEPLIAEIRRVLEPVNGLSWASGRPENNR